VLPILGGDRTTNAGWWGTATPGRRDRVVAAWGLRPGGDVVRELTDAAQGCAAILVIVPVQGTTRSCALGLALWQVGGAKRKPDAEVCTPELAVRNFELAVDPLDEGS
jgi:hypothetical protein